MPRISEFYGIAIYMYYEDHAPPHFHAMYAQYEVLIAIGNGDVLHGSMPPRALRLVREWRATYRLELERDWALARRHERLELIPPLS